MSFLPHKIISTNFLNEQSVFPEGILLLLKKYFDVKYNIQLRGLIITELWGEIYE